MIDHARDENPRRSQRLPRSRFVAQPEAQPEDVPETILPAARAASSQAMISLGRISNRERVHRQRRLRSAASSMVGTPTNASGGLLEGGGTGS
jgi:hypothetical protein